MTRTIFLSRRLIEDYTWDCVEGILRHEMAHQWVSETLKKNDAGHGEDFQIACKKLGVPPVFSGATTDSTSLNPDWTKRPICPEDEESEKLRQKVRKLLALASSTNEHEALLAMEKVREIYAKHGLERQETRQRNDFAYRIIRFHKKRIETHQSRVCSILTSHFFVRVIHDGEFDAKTSQTFQVIEIVGTRENVLMAEYVYHFLLNQVEILTQKYERTVSKLNRVGRKSYRLGILNGFDEKLQAALTGERNPAPVVGTHSSQIDSHSRSVLSLGNYILRLNKDPILESHFRERYPKLTNRYSYGSQHMNKEVFDSGRTEGMKLTLHRGISEKDGNRGKLLPSS